MIGFAVILERFCYLELPKSEVDISKQTKETIYDWGNSATAEEYNWILDYYGNSKWPAIGTGYEFLYFEDALIIKWPLQIFISEWGMEYISFNNSSIYFPAVIPIS